MAVDNPKTILVYVGLDLVGDGLMKLPFIRALRAAYPQAKITWLAGKGKSVFSGFLNPLVTGLIDEVIDETPVGSNLHELFTRPLRGRHFDLIIDTQRRALTTLIIKRISHDAFISGAGNYFFSSFKPPSKNSKPPSMVRAMMALVDLAKGEQVVTQGTLEIDPAFTEAAKGLLPEGPDYIGLSPGAGGKHKCWPQEKYIELAQKFIALGKTPVILLGPAENDWVEQFSIPGVLLPLQSETARDLKQSPLLTIALSKRLKAAVANDSGTGHMLAAGGIPLVSLFGPTPPEKFAPFVTQGLVIQAQTFGSEAMSAIPVDQVFKATMDFINRA